VSALLTVREAAARLGVGYSTLKQWIYDGTVRTVRTRGGHHRLTEMEVQRLLLSGQAEAAPASGARRARQGAKARGAAHRAEGSLVVISARNQLRGVGEEVRGDGLLVQVRLRIGDQRLTAVITRDAITELKLKRGDEAVAVIKSTEVMIGRGR